MSEIKNKQTLTLVVVIYLFYILGSAYSVTITKLFLLFALYYISR